MTEQPNPETENESADAMQASPDIDACDSEDSLADFDPDFAESSKRRWVRVTAEFIASQYAPTQGHDSYAVTIADSVEDEIVKAARDAAIIKAYGRLGRIFDSDLEPAE